MLWFKTRLIFVFLTVLSVGADSLMEDANSELSTANSITPLPIVLQLSTTISSDDFKPPTMEEKANSEERHTMQQNNVNHLNPNDVEVLDDKLGPQMAKQEEEEAEVEAEAEPEEQAAEEEAKPEDEEANEEEPAEPEPAADDKPVPEEPKKEETPGEAEEPKPDTEDESPTEEKDQTVSETEDKTPNEEAAVEAEAAATNSESEMPNDEPSKDDENPVDETTNATQAENNDKNEIYCFTCTSNDDLKCHKSPTQQTLCAKRNENKNEKQHGCYTLYETDTNITMRGCVDELAEEGLKYCLTNEKFCELCNKTGCNNKTAPNLGNMLQLNTFSLLTTMMSLITIKKFI